MKLNKKISTRTLFLVTLCSIVIAYALLFTPFGVFALAFCIAVSSCFVNNNFIALLIGAVGYWLLITIPMTMILATYSRRLANQKHSDTRNFKRTTFTSSPFYLSQQYSTSLTFKPHYASIQAYKGVSLNQSIKPLVFVLIDQLSKS